MNIVKSLSLSLFLSLSLSLSTHTTHIHTVTHACDSVQIASCLCAHVCGCVVYESVDQLPFTSEPVLNCPSIGHVTLTKH